MILLFIIIVSSNDLFPSIVQTKLTVYQYFNKSGAILASLFDEGSKLWNEPLNIYLSNHDFEEALKNDIITYEE